MKRLPTILVCLAGMTAGIVAGRMLPRHQAPTQKGTVESAASTPPPKSTEQTKERKHDLNAILTWQNRQEIPWNPRVQRELERMGAPALRRLLVEMTAIFSDSKNPGSRAARTIIIMASLELFRRDGEAALEWTATMDGDRELMMSCMLGQAARESPDLAKRWIERMSASGEFHKNWEQGPVNAALYGAKSRGVDDLIRLRESYGDLVKTSSFVRGPYPPGFDFQKLFTSLGGEFQLTDMVQYWTATDRDAAWKSVKESIDTGGKGASYSNSLFSAIAALEGGESAAKWLIPKLEELPETARVEAITSLSTTGSLSAESVGFVMASLTRESDRVALAKQLVSISSDAAGLAALRGLFSDAGRMVVLLAAADTNGKAMAAAPSKHTKAIRNYFIKTLESLDLPKESQAELMEVLESQGGFR